jgi:4-amino-4-deoxy-L-arabinose transferase-like glycosyltransferase
MYSCILKTFSIGKKQFLIADAIVAGLVCIGIVLRLWNLNQNLHFGYDQGRDALVITGMYENFKPVLIGPTTGLQGVFLGPFFYYLMLPFYFFSGGNPLVASFALVIITSFSIFAIYKLGSVIFSVHSGLIAAFLLTVSTYGIRYSQMFSNPTILLLLSILSFYLVFLVSKKQDRFLPIAGLLMGLSLQTELANAFFLVITQAFFLLFYWKNIQLNKFLLTIVFFLLTFLPQLVFNLRHDNFLLNSVLASLVSDENKTSLEVVWQTRPQFILNWFVDSLGIASWISFQSVFSKTLLFISIVFLFPISFLFSTKSSKSKLPGYVLLLMWMFIPFVSYLFYRGNYGLFFDYYLLSMFLPFYILLGYSLSVFWEKGILNTVTLTVFLFLFAYMNIIKSPVTNNPNTLTFSYQRLVESVKYVLEQDQKDATIWARPPNGVASNYEYLLKYHSKSKNITYSLEDDQPNTFYLIYEPDTEDKQKIDDCGLKTTYQQPRSRFVNWYDPLVRDKQLINKESFGLIVVETWKRI